MRKLFHSVAVASLLALCAASGAAVAQSQDNTFSGAIAPAPNSHNTAKEPEGYRGVIPGHVAPVPHQDDNSQAATDTTAPKADGRKAPRPQTAQRRAPRHMSAPDAGMSPRPGFHKQPALTAQDLKNIAAMTGVEVRIDKIPDNMKAAMHMPAHVYPLVSLPSPRRDGMLPAEYTAKEAIDRLMQQINDANNISPEAKQKAVDEAITSMNNLAGAMRIKRDMPMEIYQAMGVPQNYITETHEGSAKAVERLEAALKTVEQQNP